MATTFAQLLRSLADDLRRQAASRATSWAGAASRIAFAWALLIRKEGQGPKSILQRQQIIEIMRFIMRQRYVSASLDDRQIRAAAQMALSIARSFDFRRLLCKLDNDGQNRRPFVHDRAWFGVSAKRG